MPAPPDDLIAPVQQPPGDLVGGAPLSAQPSTPEMDSWLDSTSLGRVLDAFGQGAKAGWGEGNVVMTPELEGALREAGIFQDMDAATRQPLRFFNEAVIRPAAAGLDAAIRGGTAVLFGGAGAAAQVAEEAGVVAPGMKGRLTRDLVMVAETLGITTLTVPSPARMRGATRAERRKVMEPVQKTPERPEMPAQPFAQAEVAPVIDKAGNINLNRINAPEDVKNVIREAAVAGGDFIEGRRGAMTLKDTEDLADAVGLPADELLKRKVGQAFNAEDAVWARKALVQSAEEVFEAARKAAGGTDADVVDFQRLMTRHMAIQEQVAGLTAEAGRALSSFRILASGTKEANALGDALKGMGGRETVEEIAKRVREFNNPHQVSRFLMDARKATTSEMLIEAWINGLLSGPQTHMVNTLSNTLVALWDVPETLVASGISALRGRAVADRTLPGEAAQRLFGIVQGSLEGIRAGARAYRTEIPSDGVSKLEQPRQRTLPSKEFKVMDPKSVKLAEPKTFKFAGRDYAWSGRIELSGKLTVGGKQARLPGRLLLAEDEFFRAIGYRSELNAQAYAKAKAEGLTGRAFAERMARIVADPTDDMLRAARANASYQTFTKELGKTGKAIQTALGSHPLAKVVVPFFRTPVNIFKYTGERTVLASLSQEVRATLKGERGARAADEQAARLALGTAVSAATIGLAAAGFVTGSGPSDPRRRAVLYMTGWQPNSIRIGEMYYSFGRLEPLGTLLGVSASAYEIAAEMTGAEADALSALILGAVSKNLVDKTWTQGPAGMIEAVQDPDRYGEPMIRKLVGSGIPTIMAQAARIEDPVLRDAQTLIDAVKSRIPGLSQEVMPRRDLWGEPIALEGGIGPDILSPVYQRRISEDRVAQEMVKLGVWPAKLRRDIRGVELTSEQYDEFQMIAGRLAKTILDQQVGNAAWGALPEFARREIITGTINRARELARQTMLMRHPAILEQAAAARYKEVTGEDMPSGAPDGAPLGR